MSEDMSFLPKTEVLSLEELETVCSAFVSRGVTKLRMTGGEPLVRRNIMWLFQKLSRHLKTGDLEELTVTTNGSQLERFAVELVDLGIRRINVSLDTLDPEKFKTITRWGHLEKVLVFSKFKIICSFIEAFLEKSSRLTYLVLGITKIWTGARLLMSWNASVYSSSYTFVEGISPLIILAKIFNLI